MGSSTCGLQLNGSAAAATPAQSNDANDAVLTMKESSALIWYHLTGLRSLIHRLLLSQASPCEHFRKFEISCVKRLA